MPVQHLTAYRCDSGETFPTLEGAEAAQEKWEVLQAFWLALKPVMDQMESNELDLIANAIKPAISAAFEMGRLHQREHS